MTSFSATRLPLSQAVAAKAILADVTIVMAGSSPFEPPQSTVSAVGRSTFSRLGMPDAAQPPEFTPAQAGKIKPSLPGVSPPDIASDNAAPTNAESSPQPAFPPLSSQVASFLQSAVAFVGDGLAIVDDAEYRRRLDVCRAATVAPASVARPALLDRPEGPRHEFTCPLARWQ